MNNNFYSDKMVKILQQRCWPAVHQENALVCHLGPRIGLWQCIVVVVVVVHGALHKLYLVLGLWVGRSQTLELNIFVRATKENHVFAILPF